VIDEAIAASLLAAIGENLASPEAMLLS